MIRCTSFIGWLAASIKCTMARPQRDKKSRIEWGTWGVFPNGMRSGFSETEEGHGSAEMRQSSAKMYWDVLSFSPFSSSPSTPPTPPSFTCNVATPPSPPSPESRRT
ncbi:uncharacterized protein B0T23DRAFT_413632 [Neurospora hispaniola]|uniref:Secreted protein n=1 Tax=Neurospora hispaniola TaxID=588809 RepID=A0AAJ0I6I8_9PEZI|nr:hypothetical protein B0T23DRAFT_413632 [Neurospora hispaniola]